MSRTLISVSVVFFILLMLSSTVVAKILSLERILPLNHSASIARDQARHARMLSNTVTSNRAVNFNVEGSYNPYISGLYYTRVRLGTPAREYRLVIDTGSDPLWVACSSCTTCARTSLFPGELHFFDVSNSTTAQLVSCTDSLCPTSSRCRHKSHECSYTVDYADGSKTSGSYVSDQIYLDMVPEDSMIPNSSASIVFGCSTSTISGDFADPSFALDGIMGFGQQQPSVISQLAVKGLIPWTFSHCLKDVGGILVLGEVLDPRIVYTPLVLSKPHYNVNLQSIAVNGNQLPIDQVVFSTSHGSGTIFDSGTTYTYLPEEAFHTFVSTVNATVPQSVKPIISEGMPCYLVTESLSDVFPPMSLNFEGGASMVFRPEEYLMHWGLVDGAELWCMGFKYFQGQRITVLGEFALKDKVIVYDLSRGRIGWANYNCSSSVNVSVTLPTTSPHNSSSSNKSLLLEAISAQILLFIGLLMHFAVHNEP